MNYLFSLNKPASARQSTYLLFTLLLFTFSHLVSAQKSNDTLCDLTARQNFIKQAEELGLDVKSVVSEKIKSQCPVSISAIKSVVKPSDKELSQYQVEVAADLSRGNHEQNEYLLAAKREQDITPQLKWEMSAKWSKLEKFEKDEKDEKDESEVFEVFQLDSQVTYQKQNNPKLIAFLDLTALKDDFIGLEREASVTLGGGYALWGNRYHASCDVLKYSLGIGNKQRKLVNVNRVSQKTISHKLSFKYAVNKDVCVNAKHISQNIIGDSEQNSNLTSLMIEFSLMTQLALKAGYQRKEDRGAAIGFKSTDENLHIGLKWQF